MAVVRDADVVMDTVDVVAEEALHAMIVTATLVSGKLNMLLSLLGYTG